MRATRVTFPRMPAAPRPAHPATRVAQAVGRAACAFVRSQCVTELTLGRSRVRRRGGFVVAPTHLSHLEPVIVSLHVPRQVHWLARVEFFRVPVLRTMLRAVGAISTHRQGRPVRAVRRAVELAKRGEVVGIFPEGGVQQGEQAVFRGGPMKRGACVIARRANVPIVPCVVLGTDKLNRVAPWLPARRARVWVAYGAPVWPRQDLPRRAARFEMAERLRAAYGALYRDLLRAANLADADVP